MNLITTIETIDLQIQPGECWAVEGPEREALRAKLPPAVHSFSMEILPQLDGLLLVEALSTRRTADATGWLRQIISQLKETVRLVVVDWQADGPLEVGPALERRFKKGHLCRLLRENNFGLIETLAYQPHYYIIRAVKVTPQPLPEAGRFVDVAGLAELPKNGMKRVALFGQEIVIANTGKEVVAFAGGCPHAGSPLDQGLLRRRNLACPLHGYIWDVYTGEPVEPDDEDILLRYPVRIDPERQRILVALTPIMSNSF